MILIVDDDLAMRNMMSALVRSYGQEYAVAENGFAAIEKLKENEFSLVITDIRMPEFDGMQLLAHIREHYQGIDVIVITGYGDTYEYTDVIKAGASDFIKKPFRSNELQAKIDRIVREQEVLTHLKELTETLEAQLQEKAKNLQEANANLQDAFNRIKQLQNQMVTSKYGTVQRRFKPYGLPKK